MDVNRHREVAMRDCRNPEEFELRAAEIAAALRLGRPIEVSLAPGNGTRYPLLFVKADECESSVSPREGLESRSCGPGAVWVVVLGANSAAYPLVLMGRPEPPDPSYIAEKWFPHKRELTDDAFVLERLLREVGLATRTLLGVVV